MKARSGRSLKAAGCPVLRDTGQAVQLSHDLTRSLRRLRRDLGRCQSCERVAACTILAHFNGLVNQAIEEVVAEWNLG